MLKGYMSGATVALGGWGLVVGFALGMAFIVSAFWIGGAPPDITWHIPALIVWSLLGVGYGLWRLIGADRELNTWYNDLPECTVADEELQEVTHAEAL